MVFPMFKYSTWILCCKSPGAPVVLGSPINPFRKQGRHQRRPIFWAVLRHRAPDCLCRESGWKPKNWSSVSNCGKQHIVTPLFFFFGIPRSTYLSHTLIYQTHVRKDFPPIFWCFECRTRLICKSTQKSHRWQVSGEFRPKQEQWPTLKHPNTVGIEIYLYGVLMRI